MTLNDAKNGYGKMLILTGNTFANKDSIRELGASWDKDQKVWRLDATSMSKSYWQSRGLENRAYKLMRGGVKFNIN